MKLATRKPDNIEEIPMKMKPANPKAMEMFDWMQNVLLTVQVSVSFKVRANVAPAELADSNTYANTWSWPKSNQTCMISGKIVEALKISQIEAPISNSEYNATIEFATATNLYASKSCQRGKSEPLELVNMKIAAAREKQKAANRKTRISILKRRSLCIETVDWNRVPGNGGVSFPVAAAWSCGDLIVKLTVLFTW